MTQTSCVSHREKYVHMVDINAICFELRQKIILQGEGKLAWVKHSNKRLL